tara:strand:+ start:5573 stop:5758 length:186 start_codon:yes stop_codon:yes gene_type:complete
MTNKSMSVNNILLVLGSLVVGSISWLLLTVSELSGDVKVIRFQLNQNSEQLKILTNNKGEQ